MLSNPLFYQLLLVALVVICLILHVGLPDDPPRAPKTPLEPNQRRCRRSKGLKPFTGLIHKPLCEGLIEGGEHTGALPGQTLRGPLYHAGR